MKERYYKVTVRRAIWHEFDVVVQADGKEVDESVAEGFVTSLLDGDAMAEDIYNRRDRHNGLTVVSVEETDNDCSIEELDSELLEKEQAEDLGLEVTEPE
jgi:hypothetical protein